jgi:hypothetical protein
LEVLDTEHEARGSSGVGGALVEMMDREAFVIHAKGGEKVESVAINDKGGDC